MYVGTVICKNVFITYEEFEWKSLHNLLYNCAYSKRECSKKNVKNLFFFICKFQVAKEIATILLKCKFYDCKVFTMHNLAVSNLISLQNNKWIKEIMTVILQQF